MAIYPTSSNSFRKTDYPRPVVEDYAPNTVLRPGDFAIPAGAPRPSWMPDSSNQVSGNLAGILNEYGNPAPRQPAQMPVIPMQDAVIPSNPNIPTARQMLEDNMLRNPNQYSSSAVRAVRQRKWDEQAPERAAAAAEQKRQEVADAIAIRRAGPEAAGEAALKIAGVNIQGRKDIAEAENRVKQSIAEGRNMTEISKKQMDLDRSLLSEQMKTDRANGLLDKANANKKTLQDSLIKMKLDEIALTGAAPFNPDGSVNPAYSQKIADQSNKLYDQAVAEGLIDDAKDSKVLAGKMVFSMAQTLLGANDKLTPAEAIQQASEGLASSKLGESLKTAPAMPARPAAASGDANKNGIPDSDEQAMSWAKENRATNPIKAEAIIKGLKGKYPQIYGKE